ncbi:MAG: hypothetical protein V1875_04080 [Candidatus Altiarchaeota archaeon]
MDRKISVRWAFFYVLLTASFLTLGCIGAQDVKMAPTSSTASTVTSSSTSTTSSSTSIASSSSTSSTSTTSTTTSTSTTMPRYVDLAIGSIDKCKETQLGKMNNALVEIPGNVSGRWGNNVAEALSISCDGLPGISPYRVVFRGGNTVGAKNPLAGQYRLMVKCGHNAVLYDLRDCKNLTVTLDAFAASNATASLP